MAKQNNNSNNGLYIPYDNSNNGLYIPFIGLSNFPFDDKLIEINRVITINNILDETDIPLVTIKELSSSIMSTQNPCCEILLNESN